MSPVEELHCSSDLFISARRNWIRATVKWQGTGATGIASSSSHLLISLRNFGTWPIAVAERHGRCSGIAR